MSTRIQFNQGSQLGKVVTAAVDAVVVAAAALKRADAAVTCSMSGDTFQALADELGGGISAADAQNLWTIVRNARTTLDAGAIGELARLDRS